ncbi:MAG: sporulation protein YqfD [Firmicutes bacterium]|nr:sporulation protein YqfD [Bacillota bacterium]
MAAKYSELSFFSHRVRIRIEGVRLDRLLNSALNQGLNIRRLRMVSDTEAVCWVSSGDLKVLRRLAKSAYRITPLSEKGPWFEVRSFFRRPVLAAGCLLALILVILQSFVVETVVINGYRGIPESELLRCLEEQGIRRGVWRPGIDWAAAEKTIYQRFPEISWLHLAYDGRMVVLRISETDHEIYEKDKQDFGLPQKQKTYTNLVAEAAGYVETVQPWYGEAMVSEGDYVEKGQVLISGCIPLEPTTFAPEGEQKTEYFVQAKGEVWAKVPYRLSFNQERYLWGEPADPEDTVTLSRAEKTQAQAERKTEQQIRLWAKENLPERAEIINKSLKFFPDGNIIEVSVLLEVRQQIASPQEEFIGTEDNNTRNN